MTILLAVLLVSSLLVGYLIWSGGGFVAPPTTAPVSENPTGYELRHALPDDVAAFAAIASEPESMLHHGWDDEQLAMAVESWQSMPHDELKRTFLAAQSRRGAIGGFVRIGYSVQAAERLSIGLYVSSQHGGTGVGTSLMRAAIQSVQAQNAEAWVGTATTNVGMQRIMERLGFSPEPQTEMYDAPNGEAIESLWYQVGVGTRPPR